MDRTEHLVDDRQYSALVVSSCPRHKQFRRCCACYEAADSKPFLISILGRSVKIQSAREGSICLQTLLVPLGKAHVSHALRRADHPFSDLAFPMRTAARTAFMPVSLV